MSKTHQEHGDKGYIEDQREFFDKLVTQDWETVYQNPQWDIARQVEVDSLLRCIPTPHRVLDVGCGCGYHDMLFAQHPHIQEVVGIDYSPRSVEQANRHYPHPKVRRAVVDIVDPREREEYTGRFDLVTSFRVIEHLTKPVAFLDICAACCRDGGYVAALTPNRERLQNRAQRLLGRPLQMVDPLHFAEYTVDDLIQMGREVGLTHTCTFAHTLLLRLKNRTLVRIIPPYGRKLAHKIPHIAHVIAVVFQKTNGTVR